MGLTDIRMTISNPDDRTRSRELTFLIDSGAIFPVVPGEVLAELGITPARTRNFRSPTAHVFGATSGMPSPPMKARPLLCR